MPGEIASAFVRIRPNTVGFKSEAETGIKRQLLGVGKLVGGVFAVAGAAAATKTVVEAAARQQESMALVRKTVENTNAAWVVHGKTVDRVLEAQARHTGFSAEDTASAFTRIQLATRNTAKTLDILGVAQNLARAGHKQLSVAALTIVRAYQGSTASLRRFGLIIPPVTTEQQKLTDAHSAAIAAGGKFTTQMNVEYKAQLDAAKAADKHATELHILDVVQQRTAGSAATYAKTTAGQFAILRENLRQMEVGIGSRLLPIVNNAATGLTHFFNRIRESRTAMKDISGVADAIKGAFQGIGSAARMVGPEVKLVAQGIQAIVHTTGGGGLLAIIVGFKSLAIATNLVNAAKTRYAALLASGQSQEAVQAASVARTTEALGANATATGVASEALNVETGALARNIDALLAQEAAAAKAAAAQEALAAKYTITSVAAGESGFMIRNAAGQFVTTTSRVEQFGVQSELAGSKFAALGRGVFASIGGWTTVAALGLAAVAYGVYKLVSADSALDSANKRVLASQQALDNEFQRSADLTKDIAMLRGQIPTDRTAVKESKLAVQRAAVALATSHAVKGSLEYKQLVLDLVTAIQGQHTASKHLADDQSDLTKKQASLTGEHRKQHRSLTALEKAYLDVSKAAQQSARQQSLSGFRMLNPGLAAEANRASEGRAAELFAKKVARDAEKQKSTLLRNNERLLAEFARQEQRRPTKREIAFILNNKDVTAKLGNLQFQLDTATKNVKTKAKKGGTDVGQAYSNGIVQGLNDRSGTVYNAVANLVEGIKKTAKDKLKSHSPSQVARREIGQSISEGIALGIMDKNGSVTAALTSQLDQAIQSGVQTVQDSIISAKQNLNSIASSLAQDITNFTSAGFGRRGATSGPAGAQLKALMAQVNSGQASPSLIRHAQALQNQLSAQQSMAAGKQQDIQRKLGDIADLFNRGSITLAEAEKRRDKLLHQQGVTAGAIEKHLGPLAADTFRADMRAFTSQMKAIVASPKFGGAGLLPNIIKPLDTIRQEQKNIADAAKAQRAQMLAAEKRAQREREKHTKLLQKIHAQQVAAASLVPKDISGLLRGTGVTPKDFKQALELARARVGGPK